jgi:hypothetical protein
LGLQNKGMVMRPHIMRPLYLSCMSESHTYRDLQQVLALANCACSTAATLRRFKQVAQHIIVRKGILRYAP